MSTLTKEGLLKTIAELEEERDAVPGAVNEDAANALAAMKLAMASLEAEPVVFRSKLKPPSAIGSENWDYTDHRQPDAFELESCVIERLYTAPPAPVSDSLMSELLAIAKKAADAADECAHAEWSDDSMEHSTAIADWERRAAMLQGAEPVTTAYKLPAEAVYGYFAFNDHHGEEFFKKREDAIAFCKEAIEEYRQENAEEGCDHDEVRRTCWGIIMQEGTDFEVDNEGHIDYALTPELAGDSPVIPDGWVAVPVEPTEHMIVEGFESEPDEFFSDAELWEAYNAMTGCHQAAHRAKLCWAAMIAASQKS